jgi:hypothetical protein
LQGAAGGDDDCTALQSACVRSAGHSKAKHVQAVLSHTELSRAQLVV